MLVFGMNHKRQLSNKARSAMSAAGKKASKSDKQAAGRKGWRQMIATQVAILAGK